jgi:hypothetical protein
VRPKGGGLDKGFFYLPTLLTNVLDNARVSVEETFGPVLPVFTFKTRVEIYIVKRISSRRFWEACRGGERVVRRSDFDG